MVMERRDGISPKDSFPKKQAKKKWNKKEEGRVGALGAYAVLKNSLSSSIFGFIMPHSFTEKMSSSRVMSWM
jgi:hypothetical protein